MKLDIMRMGTKSSGFVYQKKVAKHGTHDQSSHNPHKGGGGGDVSATASALLEKADRGKVIELGSYPEDRRSPEDPYGYKTDAAKMGEVITEQGWSEASTGLTESEFEELAKNPEFVRVYRGAPAASAQAMVDGKPYIGNGAVGPGTYITTSRARAEQFAGKPDYAVIEMLVPKKLLTRAARRDTQRGEMVSRFGESSVFDSDAVFVLSAAGGNGATASADWTRFTTDYVLYNTAAVAVKVGG